MLIIGRAVAGLGGSGLSNGALTILAAAAPMHKRPGRFFHYTISTCKALTVILAIMGIMMSSKSSCQQEFPPFLICVQSARLVSLADH